MTTPDAMEKRNLIAQWAFDTRPILGRFHFWLEDVEVSWLDEDGRALDPSSLPQGTEVWCRIRVSPTLRSVQNVALTQIFPSGWEIESTRLRDEALPRNANGKFLKRELRDALVAG